MFGRVLKDKIPGMIIKGDKIVEEIRDRDTEKKHKGAEYADAKRSAGYRSLEVGDSVVAKRIQKDNKLSTNFHPEELIVIGKTGSDVTLKSQDSGRVFHRNISHLKKLHTGEV